MRKAIGFIEGALGLCVVMPIWYYLLYQILARVDASDLMWFLYAVYVPVGIFVSVIARVAKTLADEE
jgi:hypothetical protein